MRVTCAGNYVTVSSWYDLVVKEGLTTYMEQAFAADLDTAEAAAMGHMKPPPPFKASACAAGPHMVESFSFNRS